MKSAKVILIATLLVFTTASLTNADGFKLQPKTNSVIYVSVMQALEVPGLASAMIRQINPDFLGCRCQAIYSKKVRFLNVTYVISGTEQEWESFFKWGYLLIGRDHNADVNES
jgi:hypothetical protein